jgi:PAS domain S-box-containing protein
MHPLILRAGEPHEWEAAVPGARTLATDPAAGPDGELAQASCVLVGAAGPGVLERVRRVRRADATVQPVVVATAAERAALERGLLFTPGVGELWIVSPGEVGPALVERAAAVTRQRRAHLQRSRVVEHALATLEPSPPRRATISDAYLAALLEALPDPVVSVDGEGAVISLNPAAERVFGVPRPQALQRPFADLVPRIEGELPDFAALRHHATAWRRELRFRRADGQAGEGELVVVPVDAEGRRVYAVVLHDLTAERRVQHELEATAAELEAQADEMAAQAAEMEEVQAELEGSHDELQKVNALLERRSREAEAARVEAERASRAKGEFMANMSHELRTPINAIIGYAELLEMGISGPVSEAQRAQLERVRASGRHLLGLINEILDLAKVEAGQMSVARERVPLDDIVFSAMALVEPQAAERGLSLARECEPDPGRHLWGDEDRVRQILTNLLSNAVKFTEPGGAITIRCGVTANADTQAQLAGGGPWVYVRVEDTGIGIPPEQLEGVFEPFVQAESGHTRQAGGTGLGLTISRRLARLMDGDLTVQSRLGQGSCFTVWLPVAAVDSVDAETAAAPPGAAALPPGLAQVGATLQARLDEVVAALVRRLRAEPFVAAGREVSTADLQDHTAAFLSTVAQALVILEQTGGERNLMRNGSEIQRLIAERHGAQRARLGWNEDALRREIQILSEEAHAALGRLTVSHTEAVGVLDRLLVEAEQVSLRGMRSALARGPAE